MTDPIVPAPVPQPAFIPLRFLVICGNDEHAYDASLYALCPGCESAERLHVQRLLSSRVLGRKLFKAVYLAMKKARLGVGS